MIIEDLTEESTQNAKIVTFGVGGGGGNALNTMVDSKVQRVTFIAANTDAQSLEDSKAQIKLQLGRKESRGLGAGGDPTVGRKAALEEADAIRGILSGANMVFVTCGLGGGTGTGASPIIASLAKEMGALTVAVVTMPFQFEGRKRLQSAQHGLDQLAEVVDSYIVIPNDRLLETVDRSTPWDDAFKIADDVLRRAIQSISDLINFRGLINLDFNDVKAIMKNSGQALITIGSGYGSEKANEAIESAMFSPLLADTSIQGARGALLNFVGSPKLSLHEVNAAASKLNEKLDTECNIIFGAMMDDNLEDEIRLTLIATQLDIGDVHARRRVRRSNVVEMRPNKKSLEGRTIVNRSTGTTEQKQAHNLYKKSSDVGEPRKTGTG